MEQSRQSERINIDSVFADILKSDFEKVKQMTLLDNEDTLFTLYMKHPSFVHNRKYLFNLLRNMYKQKYNKLYERYPSLYVWSWFCLGILIWRSEADLKRICHMTNDNEVYNMNFNSAFTISSRKRSQITASKERHPFLNLPFYLEHSPMFELGKLTEHCVPSDFALLFYSGRTSRKQLVVKIDGVFKRTVIASLQCKKEEDSSYHDSNLPVCSFSIQLMDSVNQFLRQRSNLMLNNYSGRVPVTLNTYIEAIASKNNKIPTERIEYWHKHYIATISSFECIRTSVNTLKIHYYCDRISKLTDQLSKISDEDIAKLEKLNANQRQELMEHINEFERTVSN